MEMLIRSGFKIRIKYIQNGDVKIRIKIYSKWRCWKIKRLKYIQNGDVEIRNKNIFKMEMLSLRQDVKYIQNIC